MPPLYRPLSLSLSLSLSLCSRPLYLSPSHPFQSTHLPALSPSSATTLFSSPSLSLPLALFIHGHFYFFSPPFSDTLSPSSSLFPPFPAAPSPCLVRLSVFSSRGLHSDGSTLRLSFPPCLYLAARLPDGSLTCLQRLLALPM